MKILNVEPRAYSLVAARILAESGAVDEISCTRDELLRLVGEYDVLVTRLGHRIDREVLDKAKRLQTIVTATTGLDHIDLEICRERRIEVLSLQGETAFLSTIPSTAEHTWALILALMRRIPWAFDSVREGNWERDRFRGNQLHGKTLGVVGFGRLGRMVAGYGRCFGMRTVAHDRVSQGSTDRVEMLTLYDCLAAADVVTLHLPLTSSTSGILDAKALRTIRKGGWLVNTARGPLVDDEALIEALEQKHLSGAAIDVLPGELDLQAEAARRSSRLIEYAKLHQNLLITPHLGGATMEAMGAAEVFMARKLQTRLGQSKE